MYSYFLVHVIHLDSNFDLKPFLDRDVDDDLEHSEQRMPLPKEVSRQIPMFTI